MRAVRRIGILAGGGSIPREIADSVVAEGGTVFLVGIEGEADSDFAPHPGVHVSWGQIGRMLGAFRQAGCKDLIVVGRVRRPDLLRLRPDLGFLRILPMLPQLMRAGGDDAVLRRVLQFLESQGFRVLGPREVAPGLIVPAGPLGAIAPSEGDAADVALGFEIVRRLGPFDIGQGVVVGGGRLLAVEGVDGTDAMLRRVADRRGAVRGGVLVKSPKPGQELRVDVPVIGPETVRLAAAAGLAGIAVRAGEVMAAGRRALISAADAAGLFVAGFDGVPDAGAAPEPQWTTTALSRGRIGKVLAADCSRAAGVIAGLDGYGAARVVVVARRHVLAVEAGGEGPQAVLGRIKGQRQWGALGRRRLGVAVFAGADLIDAGAVRAAAEAGLAGIAFLATSEGEAPTSEAMAAAEGSGLFLAALAPGDGGQHGG